MNLTESASQSKPPNATSDTLEKTIIGLCINYPQAFEEAYFILRADDFQVETNRKAYSVLLSMRESRQAIDVASVIDLFAQQGIDFSYSADCSMLAADTVFSSVAWTQKFNALASLSDRLYGVGQLKEVIKQAGNGTIVDGSQMALRLKSVADDLSNRHVIQSSGYIGDTLQEDINSLARNSKNGIKFGLSDIDNRIGGMTPGQIITIGARPATGKSAIILKPFIDLAENGGIGCIFSLEMTRAEYLQRFIAHIANVSTNKVSGRETPDGEDCRAIVEAMSVLKSWKISVIDKPNMKLSDIERTMAQAKAKGQPIRLVAIDHFGLIVPDGTRPKARHEEYTHISNRLKQMAKQYECSILLLAQLNREVGEFEKPTQRCLRDTGSIEQDSDVIIFLYRDKNDDGLIHANIDKARQGGIGEFDLKFYKQNMRFFGLYPT